MVSSQEDRDGLVECDLTPNLNLQMRVGRWGNEALMVYFLLWATVAQELGSRSGGKVCQ